MGPRLTFVQKPPSFLCINQWASLHPIRKCTTDADELKIENTVDATTKMGNTYLELGRKCRDKNEQKELFERAEAEFQRGLSVVGNQYELTTGSTNVLMPSFQSRFAVRTWAIPFAQARF